MEFVVVFAAGLLLGCLVTWILIQSTDTQLKSLKETTSQLQLLLRDHTKRGMWGERIALQVLELAGFEKDKDFICQSASINDEGDRIIPDLTFKFPNNIFLHIDSKFPLDDYEKYLRADNEPSHQEHLTKFLRAVRSHVDALHRKGYVSLGQNTMPFVILFIPFESLFRFIHEQDSSIIDHALKQQVVMCSPLTLYILLATIRQSIDAIAYTQAAGEIRQGIEKMRNEWNKYGQTVEEIGKQLDRAQTAYEELCGTRERKLMQTFKSIERTIDKYRTLPEEDAF